MTGLQRCWRQFPAHTSCHNAPAVSLHKGNTDSAGYGHAVVFRRLACWTVNVDMLVA